MNFKFAVFLVLNGAYFTTANTTCEEDVYLKEKKVTEPGCVCENDVCFPKCCPFGTAYNYNYDGETETEICVETTEVFNPKVYDYYNRVAHEKSVDSFYYKLAGPDCSGDNPFPMRASELEREYLLRTDGNLYMKYEDRIPPWMAITPENYCIDLFREKLDGKVVVTLDAIICESDEEKDNQILLKASGMLVSCVFILMTVGVYLWLPKLHNVHGRVLTAYLVCLFVGFLFMATMNFVLHYGKASTEVCLFMTFVIYFSFLSAFFWLNVMCFDLWRGFSRKQERRNQKKINKLVRTYAIYAFGVPTVLTILLASLEFSGLPPNPYLPMISYQGCFLFGNSKMLYLYGPIFTLCLINIIFFVLTIYKIWKTRTEISVLKSAESSKHGESDNQTVYLGLKLFVLMGIGWILEVISHLYKSKDWIYSDIYNNLTGVLIFILFVCKKCILRELKERYTGETRDIGTSTKTHSTTLRSRSDSTIDPDRNNEHSEKISYRMHNESIEIKKIG